MMFILDNDPEYNKVSYNIKNGNKIVKMLHNCSSYTDCKGDTSRNHYFLEVSTLKGGNEYISLTDENMKELFMAYLAVRKETGLEDD